MRKLVQKWNLCEPGKISMFQSAEKKEEGIPEARASSTKEKGRALVGQGLQKYN